MKKQFLALLCVFAINSLAGCYSSSQVVTKDETQTEPGSRKTDDMQTRLKAGEAERYSGFMSKESSETYYSENCPKQLVFWQQAAQQGQAIAQSLLAGCYVYGKGIAKDGTQAVAWLRKAAEQGYAPAQYNLGVAYANGKDIAKDETQAVMWFRKAAEQGFADAQYNLGVMYGDGKGITKDETQAVMWFRKAAEQGNAPAQTNLGLMYVKGEGIAKDETQAVAWFRKAAEQGDADAQTNLGLMYAEGKGIAKDEAQAVSWFHKVAEQGFALAQHNLGVAYANGFLKIRQIVMPLCFLLLGYARYFLGQVLQERCRYFSSLAFQEILLDFECSVTSHFNAHLLGKPGR